MKLTKTVPFLLAIAAAAAVMLTVRAPAKDLNLIFDGEPEVIAATFASAWCSACKVLEPKLADVIPSFKGEPVTFIHFDFTFGPRDELEETARRYGIEEVYEQNKGATGFTVLVDRDTGEVIDVLTMNFSKKAMRAAISRAIAVASHTDEDAGARS